MVVGNLATALTQCGILMVLSKLGSEYIQGRFSLCMSIAAPLSIFLSLNLRVLMVTDVEERFTFEDYLSVRAWSCLLMVPAAVAIGAWLLWRGAYDANFVIVLAAVAGFKALEWISDICYAAFQKRQRMEFTAISQTLRAGLVLVAMLVAMLLTHSLIVATFAWLTVSAAMALGYDLRNARRFYPARGTVRAQRGWQICREAIPLVITIVLLSVNANMSGYVIAAHCSEAEVGYFTAMNYVVQALGLVFVALGTAAMPKMAEYYQTCPAALAPLLVKAGLATTAIAGAAFVASLLFGRWFLRLAYRPQYAEHVEVLWILSGGSILVGLSSLSGYAATACRAFRTGAVTWGVIVLVTLVGGIVLVPRWGIVGAAWANVASNAVAFLLMTAIAIMAGRHRARVLRQHRVPADNGSI
jgi:O-antigen/teichoic acid export membrane protein